eukprot:9105194-Pyramimonas_sp.AAC.1
MSQRDERVKDDAIRRKAEAKETDDKAKADSSATQQRIEEIEAEEWKIKAAAAAKAGMSFDSPNVAAKAGAPTRAASAMPASPRPCDGTSLKYRETSEHPAIGRHLTGQRS